MNRFKTLFPRRNNVIGMIHIGALPGTPLNHARVEELVEEACTEAEIYKSAQLDGVLVENMHDIPYCRAKDLGPEVVSCMTRICSEIRKIIPEKTPCGVQILAAANEEALAVALASNFQFVRCEGFVFAHVADEGFIDGCAGPLLRYRRNIGAEQIAVFTDIKKKHSSHAITGDVDVGATAKAAEFFLSDCIVVTGESTGAPVSSSDLQSVKKVTSLPVVLGSGVTLTNVKEYLDADGYIVGSYFKNKGKWYNSLNRDTVSRFMDYVKEHRS